MRYIITLILTDDIADTCNAECTVEAGIIIDIGNGHRGIVGRVEHVTIAQEATPRLTLDIDLDDEEEAFLPGNPEAYGSST